MSGPRSQVLPSPRRREWKDRGPTKGFPSFLPSRELNRLKSLCWVGTLGRVSNQGSAKEMVFSNEVRRLPSTRLRSNSGTDGGLRYDANVERYFERRSRIRIIRTSHQPTAVTVTASGQTASSERPHSQLLAASINKPSGLISVFLRQKNFIGSRP